jgi:hypothetical protein
LALITTVPEVGAAGAGAAGGIVVVLGTVVVWPGTVAGSDTLDGGTSTLLVSRLGSDAGRLPAIFTFTFVFASASFCLSAIYATINRISANRPIGTNAHAGKPLSLGVGFATTTFF